MKKLNHSWLAPSQTSQQRGASLLEVLIALLVVSLGLLGMAGMAASTHSYNKAAQLRLTGLALVNDYADRARVNIYGFDRDAYSIEVDEELIAEADAPTADPDLNTSIADNATTAADNVAALDKLAFMKSVASRLPEGVAVVESERTATARGMDVWLLWKEATQDATDDDDNDTLFGVGQTNCPSTLSDEQKAVYSCIYFKVGL